MSYQTEVILNLAAQAAQKVDRPIDLSLPARLEAQAGTSQEPGTLVYCRPTLLREAATRLRELEAIVNDKDQALAEFQADFDDVWAELQLAKKGAG